MGIFFILALIGLISSSVEGAIASETAPLAVVQCSFRARQLVSEQKAEEAIELLSSVLKRFPDSAELLVRRGQSLTYVDKDSAACSDFGRALQSANLNLQQCSVMIASLIDIENFDLALKVYARGKTLAGSPKQRAEFLFQAGCLLRRLNRRPEAALALIESNRLLPDNLDHWEELILLHSDQEKWDQVISSANSFEKAYKTVEKRSGLAHIYGTRGTAYMHKKQYHEAISDFTKAIEISPLTVSFFRKRAECYGKLGDSLAEKRETKKADEIVKSFLEK